MNFKSRPFSQSHLQDLPEVFGVTEEDRSAIYEIFPYCFKVFLWEA